jgi:hypothetical protein
MAPTASSKAKAGKPQETDEIAKKTLKNVAAVSEPLAGTSRTIGNRTPSGGGTYVNHEKSYITTSARSRSVLPSQHSVEAQVRNATAPTISRGNTPFSDVSSIGRKTPMIEGKASSIGAPGSLTGGGSAIGSLGAKISEKEQVPSSSRLLAPTASSLAKMNGRIATTLGTTESLGNTKHVSRIPVVRKQNTLTSITNNLAHAKPSSPLTPGKIFTKPLSPTSFSPGNVTAMVNEIRVATNPTSAASSQPPLQRQRTLSGKKPRISRSKVISRLASQRANAVKNDGTPSVKAPHVSATGKPVVSAGRTRSSLGTRTNKPTGRSSHSGLRIASGGNDLLMSAKKRVRQSEYYARRRTRVEGTKPVQA